MLETIKKMPFLTVIIPMYNCAPVIVRCMDSIDYQNCEIIVVNDGSIDNGAEVVEQYAATHHNVRLINKSNGGVSSARNLGIENAKGKYIVFVDADDYLSRDGLERMIDLAENHQADIVKYKIQSLKHDALCVYNSLKDFKLSVEIISGKAQALNRYDISDYHVVDAVFKTSTIRDNDIHFYTDLHLREDDAFMGAFYSVSSQVVVTNLPLYNYYTSSNFSHTHGQSIERQRILLQNGLLAMKHRKAFIERQCPNQIFPYERLKYMRWVCTLRQAINAELTYKEYKKILNEFRQEGVYPLDYAWIRVAGWDYDFKSYMKRILQTFMINNPWLFWLPAKWFYKRRQ
jgi:glycosyltransferase involved in cell wall biosynthesis